MGEFIDQQDRRVTRQRGVQIELGARQVAIADSEGRQAGKALGQPLGFNPSMRLDVPQHHVGPRGAHRARGLEHGVRLAHAGRGAEEDTQPPATRPGLFGLNMYQ